MDSIHFAREFDQQLLIHRNVWLVRRKRSFLDELSCFYHLLDIKPPLPLLNLQIVLTKANIIELWSFVQGSRSAGHLIAADCALHYKNFQQLLPVRLWPK